MNVLKVSYYKLRVLNKMEVVKIYVKGRYRGPYDTRFVWAKLRVSEIPKSGWFRGFVEVEEEFDCARLVAISRTNRKGI